METSLIRQAAAIMFVFASLAAALWLVRRRGGLFRNFVPRNLTRGYVRRIRALNIVERLPLTPQHTLHLLRIQMRGQVREIVLATHPQGCVLLNCNVAPREPISAAVSEAATP